MKNSLLSSNKSNFQLKSQTFRLQCFCNVTSENKRRPARPTPLGQYKQNGMPFGLKNSPSQFQNVMNDTIILISSLFTQMIFLIYSKSIEEHKKHLKKDFRSHIKENGQLSQPPKSNYSKPKLDYQVTIFIWEQFSLLIEPSNLQKIFS